VHRVATILADEDATMTKIELVRKIQEVVNDHAMDPADELIKLGEALILVGKVLKGHSGTEAAAIMTAVAAIT
jgi:hypothetical protein